MQKFEYKDFVNYYSQVIDKVIAAKDIDPEFAMLFEIDPNNFMTNEAFIVKNREDFVRLAKVVVDLGEHRSFFLSLNGLLRYVKFRNGPNNSSIPHNDFIKNYVSDESFKNLVLSEIKDRLNKQLQAGKSNSNKLKTLSKNFTNYKNIFSRNSKDISYIQNLDTFLQGQIENQLQDPAALEQLPDNFLIYKEIFPAAATAFLDIITKKIKGVLLAHLDSQNGLDQLSQDLDKYNKILPEISIKLNAFVKEEIEKKILHKIGEILGNGDPFVNTLRSLENNPGKRQAFLAECEKQANRNRVMRFIAAMYYKMKLFFYSKCFKKSPELPKLQEKVASLQFARFQPTPDKQSYKDLVAAQKKFSQVPMIK
jgi:hypothetical protein